MNSKERGRALGKAVRESEALSGVVFVALAQNETLDDETIAGHPALFPVWDQHWRGKAGGIVCDEGALYRSIHDVGAGQNTKPSQTPAMWTKVANPAEEWPAWSQPLGVHDAYAAGAKVSHNNKCWVNTHGDGNIWQPGVFGWEEAE